MTRPWSEYEGKKAIVTGAASGMGAATTKLLVEGGAEVYALDIKQVEIEGVKAALECNLLDQASIDAAIEAVGDNIDCVFGCAGLPTGFSWADTLTVNFFASRYFIEKLLPKTNKGGAIATISSLTLGWEMQFATISEALANKTIEEGRAWVDNIGDRWPEPYSFSKYCLTAWTILEAPRFMEEYGVRLNTLGPGVTESPMLASFRATSAENMDSQPNPAGRWSTPEEQAHAMMFLNSPLASYLNGVALPNDGGMHAALLSGGLKAAAQSQ